jgi:hypothetical protein
MSRLPFTKDEYKTQLQTKLTTPMQPMGATPMQTSTMNPMLQNLILRDRQRRLKL